MCRLNYLTHLRLRPFQISDRKVYGKLWPDTARRVKTQYIRVASVSAKGVFSQNFDWIIGVYICGIFGPPCLGLLSDSPDSKSLHNKPVKCTGNAKGPKELVQLQSRYSHRTLTNAQLKLPHYPQAATGAGIGNRTVPWQKLSVTQVHF